jgi:hypothetical protein
LPGLDHEELTYRYAGGEMRLTDVKGKVVKASSPDVENELANRAWFKTAWDRRCRTVFKKI